MLSFRLACVNGYWKHQLPPAAPDLGIPPAQLLCPVLRPQSLHPRPMDIAATFLFAVSTSSEVECVSHPHTEDTDMASHGQPQTSGASSSIHIQDSHQTDTASHVPFSWVVRDRRSLVQHAHTPHSPYAQAYAYLWIP